MVVLLRFQCSSCAALTIDPHLMSEGFLLLNPRHHAFSPHHNALQSIAKVWKHTQSYYGHVTTCDPCQKFGAYSICRRVYFFKYHYSLLAHVSPGPSSYKFRPATVESVLEPLSTKSSIRPKSPAVSGPPKFQPRPPNPHRRPVTHVPLDQSSNSAKSLNLPNHTWRYHSQSYWCYEVFF